MRVAFSSAPNRLPYPFELTDLDPRSDEHVYEEEVVAGPPPGSYVFDPSALIPLPASADGDVTVFSIKVPLGFDGVILGQYHEYLPNPAAPTPFVQGSGDIEWRIWIDGRYAADCGQMLVQLGKTSSLSPIHGGILLKSRNEVRYIVAAPNGSGALSPGIGNIAAGLHGYFYPRK